MSTATLTTKGQTTIPVAVRKGLGLESGDRVEFIETDPGHYEIVAATLPVTALKGIVPANGKAVSLSDMGTAIRQRATKTINH